MYLIRKTEETIASRYSEGQMRCPTHLSIGQETVPAILSEFITVDDYAVSTHRGHAHYLAKGGDLPSMIAELYGKETGCAKGKGGSMHLIDLAVNFMGTSAIVGNSIPIGVGLGLTAQLSKSNQITVIYLGDGAVEEGAFYEATNFAVVRGLKILFVCENNLYSVYSPLDCRQPTNRKITDLARAIGLKSYWTNGYNIQDCRKSLKNAVDHIRSGKGPAFVEATTYRYREHCGPNYDNDIGYRSSTEYSQWQSLDPLGSLRNMILGTMQNGLELVAEVEERVKSEVSNAFEFALKSNFPAPEKAYEGVYSKSL
jgi:pyruvate dehydrogenase E1 component alpha subunit